MAEVFSSPLPDLRMFPLHWRTPTPGEAVKGCHPSASPPAGVAELAGSSTLQPKVTHAPTARCEKSLLLLMRSASTPAMLAGWGCPGGRQLLSECPFKLLLRASRNSAVDACGGGNVLSWQISSGIVLPDLSLQLASFYEWRGPSGWEGTSLVTWPLRSRTPPVPQVISSPNQMAAASTKLPDQST